MHGLLGTDCTKASSFGCISPVTETVAENEYTYPVLYVLRLTW